MFALSLLEHKLRVPADKLTVPLEDAVRGELESIFLDKVITKLGLCVSIYDIKSIDGGFILPNEGSPTYTVVFRVIMFRPYVGEIITAKLKESAINGLRLSLEFFDDIHVPEYALPSPRRPDPWEEPQKKKPANPEEKPANPEEKPANPEEKPANPEEKPANPEEKPANPEEKPANPEEPSNQKESEKKKLNEKVRWVWEYETQDLDIDEEDEIRFQVAAVKYPPIPLEQEGGLKPFAPMVVIGSIDSDGLGPTGWWI